MISWPQRSPNPGRPMLKRTSLLRTARHWNRPLRRWRRQWPILAREDALRADGRAGVDRYRTQHCGRCCAVDRQRASRPAGGGKVDYVFIARAAPLLSPCRARRRGAGRADDGALRSRITPPETSAPKALREARTCYNHLAGTVAVQIYDFMQAEGWLEDDGSALTLYGREQFLKLGIPLNAHPHRKACCACLDWSERRFHLGETLARRC